MRGFSVTCVVALSMLAVGSGASAQGLTVEQIDLIKRTAGDVCNTVHEARGRQSNMQIEGDVRARLAGLSGRLVDAGGGGRFASDSAEFEGLTRDATALAMQGDRECRERLFNRMFDRLSEVTARPAAPPRDPRPAQGASAPAASPPPASAQPLTFTIGQSILLPGTGVPFTLGGMPCAGRSDIACVRLDGREHRMLLGTSLPVTGPQGTCQITLMASVREPRGAEFLWRC